MKEHDPRCEGADDAQVLADAFLGYANWFYDGIDYPVVQCVWPDKNHYYPWESNFNPHWVWAQPLLLHEETEKARASELLKSLED